MNLQWLARVAASAAVRRLTLLALAGVLAWCGMGDAHAANMSQCTQRQGTENKCTRAEAYAECEATHAQVSATDPSFTYSCNWRNQFYYLERDDLYQSCHGVGFFPCSFAHMAEGCPAGGVWDESTHQCNTACTEREPYGPAMAGNLYMCSGGCRYEMGDNAGLSVCLGSGSSMNCMGDNWTPTGDSCQANDKPPKAFDPTKETCRSLGDVTGSYNECIKPNGDHCVTSATGAVLCWKPSDIGDRITTDGKTAADREVAPATPQPPENQQDPTQQGPTSTTTINGNTYNTSVYSGTGNTGGQGNTGTGGKNTGGTGDPKGEGEGDGDKDGPGGAGSGVGDLYDGNGKTVASVFDTFKAQVQASPLVGAADGFLTVSVSASCPAFSVPETFFWPAMEFTYHCTGPLADALALGAYLLLAIAAYTAFKIGFG